MELYDEDNYKAALRSAMADRRLQFGPRFTFEKMANACGIQKTYLSKVLNGEANLNSDQLFAATEYLKLKPAESEHLLNLRELQITMNPRRREILKTKIKKARADHLKTESAIEIQNDRQIQSHGWDYYTDVDLQLVHMFLTVREFADAPEHICDRIGIDVTRLHSILLKLQTWGLIHFRDGAYLASDPKLHLSEDSPVFLAFGILNRIKTLEKLRRSKTEKTDDYFFSAVFSGEAKLQEVLKRKILNLLKETQKEVVKSKSEQVFQLNIDFFCWS